MQNRSEIIGRVGRLLLSVLLLSAPLTNATDAGVVRLKALLGQHKNLSADFVQIVADAEGKELQRSAGKMTVQRPHYMRWESTRPFQYLIITDGVKLWRYDADLDQLNVEDFTEETAQSPAMVLGSGGADLELAYAVEAEKKDGREIFDLLPLGKESAFEKLTMEFIDGQPVVLRMRDFLGQVTRLELSGVKTDRKIKRSYFRYQAEEKGG